MTVVFMQEPAKVNIACKKGNFAGILLPVCLPSKGDKTTI
jgi:hypothetical protein